MELLKTLKLTQYQRNNRNNPALERRIKLVARISGQILLAQDPNCKSHSVRTAADDSGELREVEVSIRVLRQWRVSADGSIELTVRYGSRVLELAKDMDAVELASKDELVPVLKQFKAVAEHGEMDDMIAGTVGKAKTC